LSHSGIIIEEKKLKHKIIEDKVTKKALFPILSMSSPRIGLETAEIM